MFGDIDSCWRILIAVVFRLKWTDFFNTQVVSLIAVQFAELHSQLV